MMLRYVGAAAVLLAAGGTAAAQSRRAIGRSVRAASLVVLAKRASREIESSRVRFSVIGTLKGRQRLSSVTVNLEKAPVGLWPKRSSSSILCLARRSSGRYELATHFGSILSSDDGDIVRRAVKLELPPVVPRPTGNGKPVVRVTPADTEAELRRRRVAESDTILVGALSDVREAGPSTFLAAFKVEEALVGYGGYGSPITVRFAGQPPVAGRYLFYLRGSATDGSFVPASSKWGIVRIHDAAAEEKLKASIRAAIGKDRPVLTTIQATLAEWQVAWNKRELERCIRCYSRQSTLRKLFERSDEGRKSLLQQIRSFPGAVELSLQRISLTRTPGPRATSAADVTVLLKLAAEAHEDRRSATMKFVFEDGQWLILEEGF